MNKQIEGEKWKKKYRTNDTLQKIKKIKNTWQG